MHSISSVSVYNGPLDYSLASGIDRFSAPINYCTARRAAAAVSALINQDLAHHGKNVACRPEGISTARTNPGDWNFKSAVAE